MTNTCKYCGGLIDQSASFCDSRCEDLFSKYTPTCKQCAAKDAENERLKVEIRTILKAMSEGDILFDKIKEWQ